MLATDVKQEELERDYQMERLRKICDGRGIKLLQVKALPKYYIVLDKKMNIVYVDRSSSGQHISEFIEYVFLI